MADAPLGRPLPGVRPPFTPRRFTSSSISAVREAPMRVTPAARYCRNVSRSRMPPAAFTCTRSGECSRISCTSSSVAPPVP